MESSIRSTERSQPPSIVLLLTLPSRLGYFPAAKRLKTHRDRLQQSTQLPPPIGVRPKTNPSEWSGYTRSEQ
jgi:hypothetical protein